MPGHCTRDRHPAPTPENNRAFIELDRSAIMRASRYKSTFQDDKALELYDLEKDPQERDNLIGRRTRTRQAGRRGVR